MSLQVVSIKCLLSLKYLCVCLELAIRRLQILLNCAGKITIKKVTISIQSLMQLRLTEGL